MQANNVKLFFAVLFVFALLAVASYFLGKSNGEREGDSGKDTVTVTKIDTLRIEIPRVQPKYYRVTDTVFSVRVQELDSLQRAILGDWKTTITDTAADYGTFVARIDTVLPDGAGTATIQHFSRVPFDPQSYFSAEFIINQKYTEKTVYIPRDKSFWETYFHFGIVAAMGYGFGSQRADAFIGVGAMIGF